MANRGLEYLAGILNTFADRSQLKIELNSRVADRICFDGKELLYQRKLKESLIKEVTAAMLYLELRNWLGAGVAANLGAKASFKLRLDYKNSSGKDLETETLSKIEPVLSEFAGECYERVENPYNPLKNKINAVYSYLKAAKEYPRIPENREKIAFLIRRAKFLAKEWNVFKIDKTARRLYFDVNQKFVEWRRSLRQKK